MQEVWLVRCGGESESDPEAGREAGCAVDDNEGARLVMSRRGLQHRRGRDEGRHGVDVLRERGDGESAPPQRLLMGKQSPTSTTGVPLPRSTDIVTRLEARRVDVDPFVVARWPLVVRVRVALPSPVHHFLEGNELSRVRLVCPGVLSSGDGGERTSELSIRDLSSGGSPDLGTTDKAVTLPEGFDTVGQNREPSPEFVPVKRAIRYLRRPPILIKRGRLRPVDGVTSRHTAAQTANGERNDLGKVSRAVRVSRESLSQTQSCRSFLSDYLVSSL